MLNNFPLQIRFLAAIAIPTVAAIGASAAGVALGDGTVRAIGIAGFVLAVVGAAVALAIIRSTTQRLQQVSIAAEELARERLPKLVGNATTEAELATITDFEGEGDDELGRVVKALNTVQSTTAGLSTKQHEQIREGLGELVVNLVRRNQSLLKRQIEHIDDLESSEEDPDRLKGLFGVDHLATRMRRNSESLLVLAGAEPPRRKGTPISIANLMRVAMSEIEGYQQVHLGDIDEGEVNPQVAFDLAHLTSELMENATHFSPPTVQVDVYGVLQETGDYLISVIDHGIGMSEEQIADANTLLANPPELNLSLGRSLGFIVVSRLAKRLGISVELMPTAQGAGVTSSVSIPAALLGSAPVDDDATPKDSAVPNDGAAEAQPPEDDAADDRRAEPRPSPGRRSEDRSAQAGSGVALTELQDEPKWAAPTLPERGSGGLGQREASENPASPIQSDALDRLLGMSGPTRKPRADAERGGGAAESATPPEEAPVGLEQAIPTGDSFDAGVASLLDGDAQRADASQQPPTSGVTSTGLVKRDRSRSSAPSSEGRTIPEAGMAATASTRDPQEIRSMLARYREARDSVVPSAEAATTAADPNNESEGQP